MIISTSLAKHFSIQEHLQKIQNNFIDSKLMFFKEFNIYLKKNDRFLYSIINQNIFNSLKNNFIQKNNCSIFNGNLVKFLIQNNFLEHHKLLTITNTILKDEIQDIQRNIPENYIIQHTNKLLFLDTSLFGCFYINYKTSNHFSYLIVNDAYNIYLLKRSNYYVCCMCQI